MSSTKIELNRKGVRDLLRSREMRAICRERADAVRARLGAGYTVSSYTGKNRVNASIIASSKKARRENSEGNTILKALK